MRKSYGYKENVLMKNKILKRALMLGALIGCMATAAWAGNVEIDITDTEFGRGAPEVQYVADGYYVTSSQYGSRATSGCLSL